MNKISLELEKEFERATELSDLARLHSDVERLRESKEAAVESLALYTQLEKKNPGLYATEVERMRDGIRLLRKETSASEKVGGFFSLFFATFRKG